MNVKKMLQKKIWAIFVVSLLCAAIIFTYKDLSKVFYLNDEWRMLANVYIHGLFATWYKEIITDYPWYILLLGKTRILSTLINNIILLKYPLNVTPFIIFFYFLHVINSILVYVLALNLSKRRSVAIITSIFFAITIRHSQSIIWIGSGVQVLLSGMLAFISFLLLLKYLVLRKKRYILLFVLISYISFLIRPNSIFLYFFFLCVLVLTATQKTLVRWFSWVTKYYLVGLICFSSLIWLTYKLSNFGKVLFSGSTLEIIKTGTVNSFYYPFISLGHYFLHPDILIRLSKWCMNFLFVPLQSESNLNYLTYTFFPDLITWPISVIFIIFVVYIWVKWKKMRGSMLIAGLWYFSGFLPVNFFLLQRYSSFIESRYVYYQSFSVGFFIGIIFVYIYQNVHTWVPKIKGPIRILLLLLLCLFFAKQIQITQREVTVWAQRGQEMSTFIKEWKNSALSVPDKPIFYVVSDRGFMNPYTRLPFMLGDGFVLSVLLYPTGKIPASNMRDQFLSAYGSQGYREEKEKGYGYFYNMEELVHAYKSDLSLNSNQIIAFYYYGFKHKIVNITDEIKEQLEQRLQEY